MSYLEERIRRSPICRCRITYVSREEAEAAKTIPTAASIAKAKRRFNALHVEGGTLLTDAIMHIEHARNQVFGYLSFNYDQDHEARQGEQSQLEPDDEEIDEMPWLRFGDPDSPPAVLAELVELSKRISMPENRSAVDRELLSVMMQEAAYLLIMSTSQGSA